MVMDVVILGASGFAREVLDVFEACNQEKQAFNVLGFLVDPQFGKVGTEINGREILGGIDWLDGKEGQVRGICGVGAPQLRLSLVRRAAASGCRFCSVVHPDAILTRHVRIGSGVVITAGCILTNNIRIGDHVHLNLGCTVGHDAVLEDFVTTAPGVHVSGNVVLSEGAYVGTGANILERVDVGRWSIIGAGSTVIQAVPADSTAVGCPAKVIKQRPGGWHLEP